MTQLRHARSWTRRLTLLALGGFLAATPAPAQTRVTVYPFPQQLPASPRYRVIASGQTLPTMATEAGDFAAFALQGQAEITIVHDRQVTNVVVRPRARGIRAETRGGQIRFTVDRHGPLCVEINGDLRAPLFLFIDPPETDVPARGTPGVMVLASNKVHDLGEIRLREGQTLYLEPGAVMRGTVRARDARRVTIRGRGLFDARPRTNKTHLIEFRNCANVEVRDVILLGSLGWTLVPWECQDVRVRQIKVLGWRDNDDGLDICGSRRVRVDGCFFRTKDDCISIKSLGGEYFSAAANTAGPPAARLAGREVADVEVRRSVFWNAEWGNALEIGFELHAPRVHRIVWRECDILREQGGAVFSIHNGDAAVVEDVLFRDIRVEDAQHHLVDFRVGLSIYSADCPDRYHRRNPQRQPTGAGQWVPAGRLTPEESAFSRTRRGVIRNIRFQNIHLWEDTVPPSFIVNDGGRIESISFENVRAAGRLLAAPADLRLTIEGAAGVIWGP